jgi:hypothetical protein
MSEQINIPKPKFRSEIEDAFIKLDITWPHKKPPSQQEVSRYFDDFAAQVRRHVDLPYYVENPTLEVRYIIKCQHCESKWHPDEFGCNGCCEKNMEEWRKEILELNPCYRLNKDGDKLIPI